ncbi:zinc finger and BTB domain-containing protein 41-like isoform X2 [Plodia interpunctella]|uniref:zinc finger and BTB domain-containing protein 41-like isoform X2 n=1 Tax=Plodia interpunctella TaxID=58824 RepID=UPI002367549D|nr:zinc finger and BTB domain-containing protein 41-like isoform X2 [Plodia interpunctella]
MLSLRRSLFQHNLTHLFVPLEKLPDKILDFYEPPDVPTESNSLLMKRKMDILENTETKPDMLIKCEIVECDSEIMEQIIDTESKTDSIVNQQSGPLVIDRKLKKKKTEDNNNEIPITKRDHQCNICLKVFNYKHWHAHMNEVHSTITITCKLCKKDYKSKKSLRKHSCGAKPKEKVIKKINPKDLGSFKCSECNSVFNSKDCMQKHVKNVHSKAVRCEICNSRLGSEMYLAAHIRRVHYDDGKVHSCDVCGKIFKSPRYVKIHMKNTHCKKSNTEDSVGNAQFRAGESAHASDKRVDAKIAVRSETYDVA